MLGMPPQHGKNNYYKSVTYVERSGFGAASWQEPDSAK
jgi:hypothetical protein